MHLNIIDAHNYKIYILYNMSLIINTIIADYHNSINKHPYPQSSATKPQSSGASVYQPAAHPPIPVACYLPGRVTLALLSMHSDVIGQTPLMSMLRSPTAIAPSMCWSPA